MDGWPDERSAEVASLAAMLPPQKLTGPTNGKCPIAVNVNVRVEPRFRCKHKHIIKNSEFQ